MRFSLSVVLFALCFVVSECTATEGDLVKPDGGGGDSGAPKIAVVTTAATAAAELPLGQQSNPANTEEQGKPAGAELKPEDAATDDLAPAPLKTEEGDQKVVSGEVPPNPKPGHIAPEQQREEGLQTEVQPTTTTVAVQIPLVTDEDKDKEHSAQLQEEVAAGRDSTVNVEGAPELKEKDHSVPPTTATITPPTVEKPGDSAELTRTPPVTKEGGAGQAALSSKSSPGTAEKVEEREQNLPITNPPPAPAPKPQVKSHGATTTPLNTAGNTDQQNEEVKPGVAPAKKPETPLTTTVDATDGAGDKTKTSTDGAATKEKHSDMTSLTLVTVNKSNGVHVGIPRPTSSEGKEKLSTPRLKSSTTPAEQTASAETSTTSLASPTTTLPKGFKIPQSLENADASISSSASLLLFSFVTLVTLGATAVAPVY